MNIVNFLLPIAFLCMTTCLDANEIRFDFENEETEHLEFRGNVTRDQAGPRPPEFPDLAATNNAIRVDSSGYVAIPDPGNESPYDFHNGDEITIEAWINPDVMKEGQPCYIIGKGRTGSPKFRRDNQNWALRTVQKGEQIHLSFLFATSLTTGDRHWHRWTSTKGFPMLTGWHHVAVSYRFGDSKTVRGWIDGVPTDGKWDMGGASDEPPVVDNDEIRIGISFVGLMDAVAVHRKMFDDKAAASRYRRVGEPRVPKTIEPEMPELADLPPGRVQIQFHEAMPSFTRWLYRGESWPEVHSDLSSDSFLIHRLPAYYDTYGVRAAWPAPLLLRMAADVELPVGHHQFMMRARSLGRLWIDGQLVAETEAFTKKPPDGEEPIIPVPEPPLPGVRARGYNQQEAFGEIDIEPADNSPKKLCRVVLEIVVGGSGHRTETGEVCVAVRSKDGQSYQLLTPNRESVSIPLTDKAIEAEIGQMEAELIAFEDHTRETYSQSQDSFWQQRRKLAEEWLATHPAPKVPGDSHPVDAFIVQKINRLLESSASSSPEQAKHFHEKILPVLSNECFRCHGDKVKGGLRLNNRAAALKSGDSEIPAIVPGDPDSSELVERIRSDDESLRMPPTESGLSQEQIDLLVEWVKSDAPWPAPPIDPASVSLAALIDDEAFIRRIYLDLLGVPPQAEEVREFLASTSPSNSTSERRLKLIDKLLDDNRFADRWMPFWLDVLAENPTLLNASLNSTGPFRWFLYDSMKDHKPLDRMVTELIMLRGGAAEGGSAGFGLAGENDAPFAAKGHIVASAFLGIELQCARCHDSPYHSTTQKDLYSLAAMFSRKSVTVPGTSRVPDAFFEAIKARESLIQVTLSPNEPIKPEWPFASLTGVADGPEIDGLTRKPDDTRERLAALITGPQNERFTQVIVNRIWKELIGVGFVEPIHDWEGNEPSHPELLQWLSRELVASGYDMRALIRLIVSSDLYQREAVGQNLAVSAELRVFNAPDRRRLTAEQIADSLHVATGKPFDVEELTFVHDGRRPLGSRQTLGKPTRAWMFGDLKNERDRPSLSLPKARAVADILEAFGWTGARQMPINERQLDPNVLQPGILANGTLSFVLTRASWQSELAEIAIEADSPEQLVEEIFLRVLGRNPTLEEAGTFRAALAMGFEERLVDPSKVVTPDSPEPLPQVTWFNHLRPRANEIQLEREQRFRQGPPVDPRLNPAWREVYEDFVWSLINHHEFVWMP